MAIHALTTITDLIWLGPGHWTAAPDAPPLHGGAGRGCRLAVLRHGVDACPRACSVIPTEIRALPPIHEIRVIGFAADQAHRFHSAFRTVPPCPRIHLVHCSQWDACAWRCSRIAASVPDAQRSSVAASSASL